MSDKEKIKAAVSKLRRKDPRVIAIRNMIALAKVTRIPENGKDGIDGAIGADGINGIDGLRGADGAHGAKGIDGSKGDMGAVGPQGDKGEAGMVWRGTYRSDIEYWIGDVVGVSGSAYVCVAATNQAPPVGFGWELLVSRGAQGIRGIKGEDGTGGGGAAAAGTLTGTALASNVVTSSLTTVGTLANLTVTNTITGSVSGNAGTVTSITGNTLTSGIDGSNTEGIARSAHHTAHKFTGGGWWVGRPSNTLARCIQAPLNDVVANGISTIIRWSYPCNRYLPNIIWRTYYRCWCVWHRTRGHCRRLL